MINSKNDLHFLYLNFRSIIGFKILVLFNWFFKGHFFLKRNLKKYYENNNKIKIHFAASKKLDGFLNSQILGDNPIDITKKLPLNDSTVDLIYSSHLLEHIHKKEIEFFLRDSFRVLKKNGMNIISTPSLNKLFAICFQEKNKRKTLFIHGKKFYDDDFHSISHQINLSMRAFGHRFLVEENFLKNLALSIGYKSLREVNYSNIPNKEILKYIKDRKPKRWLLETSHYILVK